MTSILKKKLNKKGFTLAELLVVVAIIAILVAIAVPVFTGASAKAKQAVLDADERAARSQATVEYLLNERTGDAYYSYTVNPGGDITVTFSGATGTESGPTQASDTKIVSGTLKITATNLVTP